MDERVGQYKDAEDQIGMRYRNLSPVLDERRLRLWLGAEAMAIGRGGIAVVARATKQRRARIAAGLRELSEGDARAKPGRVRDCSTGIGVRRPGGGRKRLKDTDPTLVSDLDSLISPAINPGDGVAGSLRWTVKSLRRLSAELAERGHAVSPTTVAELLHGMGFSVRTNTALEERFQHPDRESQFFRINEEATRFLELGLPVVSVETEKKTLAVEAQADAPGGTWVRMASDHLTPQFAAAAVATWWTTTGKHWYPGAHALLLVVDSGGINPERARLWRRELQRFADGARLVVEVCHFPMGTRMWSRIACTLVSTIFRSAPGEPRVSDATLLHVIRLAKAPAGDGARLEEPPPGASPSSRATAAPPEPEEPAPSEPRDDWHYIVEPRP